MDISTFSKKNDLVLTADEIALCEKGIKFMRNSLDRHHEETHIFRMLDTFLILEREYMSVDHAVTVLSICWHDVWKSRRIFIPKKVRFMFDQVFEGIGSAIIFFKNSKGISLRKRFKSAIAILLHVRLDVVLPRSLRKIYAALFLSQEARLLQDLDALESCNLEFLENFKKVYTPRFKKYPEFLDIWNDYYYKGFRNMKETVFYSKSAKRIFRDQIDKFQTEAEQYLKGVGE
ncbi:hypothetical protein KC717_01515 [Candidatus Dojkabacteria bacterium]|uniref:HD domain-containing protein n=1 Tax=Candidatus Dojkabacteria bacterium TaxID=2099670 RepID=A0A955L7W7_9BACT|nr:hypothetical protein [Candidatus Dojkabacteria bacterium]